MKAEPIQILIKAICKEYSDRQARNPAYSLRAFSRFLGVDTSHLSKFIRGKKGFSSTRLLSLGKKINLDRDWAASVEALANKNNMPGEIYSELSESELNKMHHWYYMAISELPLLKGFQNSPEWVAKTLDITVQQATEALTTLKACGIALEIPSGRKKAVVRPTSWSIYRPGQTSHQRRENQKQFLRKAIAALDNIPIDRRDQSSMLFAANAKNLPKARLLIQKFKRDLSRLMAKQVACEDLYLLSVSLYPLT